MLFVLSIVLVIITPLNANVLGFDTFTLLITSIIFTSFITFMRDMTPVKLCILSFLCAIAVFIRLPNIILLILIPIILLIDKLLTGRSFKIYVKRSLIFFILSLGFIAGGYLLMFSSEPNFGESFITNGKYHNIRLLIFNYFLDGLTLLFYSTVIFLCYLLIKRKVKNKYVPMLVIIFLILFLSAFIIHSKYSRSYSLFLT
ncbi:MAG: hypothetical protein R3214_07600, partial [Christiangramia sp.]|nr:hypothetical protein [Christiangramia sp.]